MRISVTRFRHPLLHSIALHWMPIPMPMPIPTHTHGFWVGMGFVHPYIQLQIRVKLLGCREYANQEALWVEANDNE